MYACWRVKYCITVPELAKSCTLHSSVHLLDPPYAFLKDLQACSMASLQSFHNVLNLICESVWRDTSFHYKMTSGLAVAF